jgi:hypothetical protein
MRRSGTGSGGGYGMSKVRNVRAPKVEPKARAVNPGGVAQLGQKQGNHITDRRSATNYTGDELIRGKGYMPPGMISDPVKAVGVGGGREVMRCGSQGTQGKPASGNPPPRGELFPGFKR